MHAYEATAHITGAHVDGGVRLWTSAFSLLPIGRCPCLARLGHDLLHSRHPLPHHLMSTMATLVTRERAGLH